MIDERDRTIDYIRISVTDRCNFRCSYCMPAEGVEEKQHDEILSYEEILRICRVGAKLGITKVKITGGEPLVRKGLCWLVKELCLMDGIKDVTMTSNGYLLAEHAKALKMAGLSAVNVSLDTLDGEEFAKITRRDGFAQVMNGIEAAVGAGLMVKVNCAVMKELSEQELTAFAELSERYHIPVRFIEMMPIGQGKAVRTLSNDRLIDIFTKKYADFTAEDKKQRYGNGPALYYGFHEGRGCVGFISAVHHKFCSGCNRVRLTADGYLKLCLDSPAGLDLRTPLREGCTDETLMELMAESIRKKPESHHFEMADDKPGVSLTMNQIGG